MNQIYLNKETSNLKKKKNNLFSWQIYKTGFFPSQTMYQVCDEVQEMGQGIVIFSSPDLKDSFWVGEMSKELAMWLAMR